MAHFAELDENNIVLRVIVVSNDVLENRERLSGENIGVEFCKSLLGNDTRWVQCSYNSSFRYHYPGVEWTFDANKGEDGVFIPPRPFPSFELDENEYVWKAPIPYPQDGKRYSWNESKVSWDLIPEPTIEVQ